MKMFKENFVEALIGAMVLVVGASFVVYAYNSTEAGRRSDGYPLYASFLDSTGVGVGTDVRVSGIKVGSVVSHSLDPATYRARLEMVVDEDVQLPIDSVAAITSEGILGGSYISLRPGGDPDMLQPGDEFEDTQGSVDLMSLIGQVINRTGSEE